MGFSITRNVSVDRDDIVSSMADAEDEEIADLVEAVAEVVSGGWDPNQLSSRSNIITHIDSIRSHIDTDSIAILRMLTGDLK